MRVKNYVPATEALAFQTPEFHNAVAAVVAARREADLSPGKKPEVWNELTDIIKKFTNMSIVAHLDPVEYVNLCVLPPDIRTNHALIVTLRRNFFSAKQSVTEARKRDEALRGWIDERSNRVGGFFADVKSKLYVTNMTLETAMTDHEIAAAILHEVGHVWTYFRFIGRLLTVNFTLDQLSQELTTDNPMKHNFELVRKASLKLGTKVPNIQEIVSMDDTKKMQTVVIDAVVQAERSDKEYGDFYNATGWESLSDQYVVRCGGGKDLSGALDKIYRMYHDDAYMPKMLSYVLSALSLICALILVGFVVVLTAIFALSFSLMGINPRYNLYDHPKDRMERIKRDMISQLRDDSLGKERKRQILEDIDSVQGYMDQMNKNGHWFDTLLSVLRPRWIRENKEKDFQRKLEEMANSDLYVTATRFDVTA